jgi:uncharacterized circularly permuted ATP-grasp superfamily protein/uncharacterized alpha-E superfamily protein
VLQSQLPLEPDLDALPPHEAAVMGLLARSAHFDELRQAGGGLRPAWAAFFAQQPESFWQPEAFSQRAAAIESQVAENGITHNVYADSATGARPWPLEQLPLLIEPHDWRVLSAGLVQRARLLEAVARDIYGPQALLAEGAIAPALVLGHPGYLRPLRGVAPALGQFLYTVAFDVVRDVSAPGGWWIKSRRTQAPSGLGYVMENRIIISRLFPDAFRELHVQHLASGYRRMLDALTDAAASCAEADSSATPRIVLLTPGPLSETYFEQAYLARYLGLPLVEGADLTVRGDRLFLKTVQGLEPVHGLLRRLDDDYCDPLELRPDSALGVPGLLQVLRAGRLAVSNALGTGFLESAGLAGFMPKLCQRLLGEDLLLQDLPSWWCGEAAVLSQAREALNRGVLVHAYPDAGNRAQDPLLGPSARALAQIAEQPENSVVQAHAPASVLPVWQAHRGLVPREAVLRVVVVADAQGQWQVLPGGLTRTFADSSAWAGPSSVHNRSSSASAQAAATVPSSLQRGGRSHDTWVLTEGEVDTYTMLPRRLGPDDVATLAQHRQRPVTSRTGENLFWMGRYTERTEHQLRLVRVISTALTLEDVIQPELAHWLSNLARSAALVPFQAPGWQGRAQGARASRVFERVVLEGIAGRGQAASLAFNLKALQQCAAVLRDRLSTEHWRLVSGLHEGFTARLRPLLDQADGLSPTAARLTDAGVDAALDHLAIQLAAATGAQTDRMTRDVGWRLLAVGRLVERLIGLSSSLSEALMPLDAASVEPPVESLNRPVPMPARCPIDRAQGFEALLALFDSTITYLGRHQRQLDPLALLDVVLMDDTNPRSIAGVLRRLRTELGKLPRRVSEADDAGLAELLAMLPAQGPGVDLASLWRLGTPGGVDAQQLRAHCLNLTQVGMRLSDAISQRHFAVLGSVARLACP